MAFALAGVGAAVHLATILIVAVRLQRPGRRLPLADTPPVTLLRPLRGLGHGLEAALESGFRLSYRNIETIFCVEDESDSVVPLVRKLIAGHPEAKARLLVGRDQIGNNPKINNIVKGWNAATSDWIIVTDGNTLLPTDYVEGLLACWDENTGVVSSAWVVVQPLSFAAEIECAFINTFLMRWAMAGASIGMSVVHGITMLWRRDILERLGGLAVLAADAGDELAAQKAVRRAGLKARLAGQVQQAAGRRRFADVWGRQVRWARVVRIQARGLYRAEFFSAGFWPIMWVGLLTLTGALPGLAFPVFVAFWYGIEAALTAFAGWPLSWRMPFAWVLRDTLLFPAVWIAGLFGDSIDWRGRKVAVLGPRDGPDPEGQSRGVLDHQP